MKFKILGRQFQVSMTIGPRSHPGEQQVFREPSNKPFDKHDIQAALQMARLMGQSRDRGRGWAVQPRDFCSAWADREH